MSEEPNVWTLKFENYILTARFIAVKSRQQIAGEAFLCAKQVRRICYAALEKIVLPEDAVWLDGCGKVVYRNPFL